MPQPGIRSLAIQSLTVGLLCASIVCHAQQETPAASAGTQTQQPAPANDDTASPRYGPGAPMHIGGDVVPPKLIHSVDPTFSDEARAEKFSGTVQVYLWVDRNGNPTHVRVVRGVGHGLDEEAVKAIRQYKFQPATLNGEPVTVDLYIQVNFQIKTKQ